MTLLLHYSCVATPVQIALYAELGTASLTINAIVDLLFLVDMIIIFNSAIMDDQYNIIEDRSEIAKNYLSLWFWIDLVAILPF